MVFDRIYVFTNKLMILCADRLLWHDDSFRFKAKINLTANIHEIFFCIN